MTSNADYKIMDGLVRNTLGVNAYQYEGVTPDYGNTSWGYQGRLGLGNNNPESGFGLTKITPWGVIFRNKNSPPDADTLVKVGNLELYELAGGTWSQAQAWVRPNGALYLSSFLPIAPGDDNTTAVGDAPVFSAAPNMLITQVVNANQAYHFYIPRTDYAPLSGIIVQFSAKLVSKSGADMSAKSGCLLAQIGCDFKSPDGTTIREAFDSKGTPVTKDMRRFSATSMTLAQLIANPPDLSLFAQLTQTDPVGVDPDYTG